MKNCVPDGVGVGVGVDVGVSVVDDVVVGLTMQPATDNEATTISTITAVIGFNCIRLYKKRKSA